MTDLRDQRSAKKTARITGILYLVIIICAGFSEGFVRSGLIVAGDAGTTAANIMASEGLFRISIASDLIAFLADALVAVLFYILLRPVDKTLALVAASLRLVAHPAIASLNLLNQIAALHLLDATGFLGVFEPEQLHASALVLLNAHDYGYLIAGVFFGLHLLFLGFLIYRSDLFPAVFGILLYFAGAGYLIESFGTFLLPVYRDVYTWMVALPAVAGEVSLTLYLIIKGSRA